MAKNHAAFTRVNENEGTIESSLLFKGIGSSDYISFTILHKSDDEFCLDDMLTVKSIVHADGMLLDRIKKAIRVILFGEASVNNIILKYNEIAKLKGFVNDRTIIRKNKFLAEE